jgi:hypothetical protein
MEQLKAYEEHRRFSDNLVDVNLDAITQRLESVERACVDVQMILQSNQ